MTFKKMFEIAEGGESCIFMFPNNDAARKYVDFVASHRPIQHCEAEIYKCGTQMHYELGDCVGTSVIGYQNYGGQQPTGNWYYYEKRGATVL